MPDLNKKVNLAFGGNTPEEQIRTNLFLNLLSAIVSLILAVSLYWTFGWKIGDVLLIIYIVAAFLLAMCGWQFSTFIIGLKLRRNFNQRKGEIEKDAFPKIAKNLSRANTKELLVEADLTDVVSTSVRENTTKHLFEKISKKSS